MATQYSLSGLTGIDFNLYPHEDISIESYDTIQAGFISEYEDDLKTRLHKVGLKYVSITQYHPKYYNYEGDDLTLSVEIECLETLVGAIFERYEDIQKELDKNVSYDGYISTTANTTKDVIEEVCDCELDIIALRVLLDIEFMFDVFEYVIYDDEAV